MELAYSKTLPSLKTVQSAHNQHPIEQFDEHQGSKREVWTVSRKEIE